LSAFLANLPIIAKVIFGLVGWWVKYVNKDLEMAESFERFKLASAKKGAIKVKNFSESEELLTKLQMKIKLERLKREKANKT